MENMEVCRSHHKSKLKLPSKSESDLNATSKRHERRKKKLRLEKCSSSGGVRANHERKVSRRRKIRPEPQCSHEGIGIVLEDALEISWKRQAEYLHCLMKDGKSDPKATFHPWSCLAEVALVQYHKEQGIELDLLKMLKENGKLIPPSSSLEPGAYHHIFFKAVPKNVDCADLSPQLFFAEIFDCGAELHPTHCFVIKPNDDPVKKRKLGCGICPDDEEFPHPTTGFIAGHFPYVEV